MARKIIIRLRELMDAENMSRYTLRKHVKTDGNTINNYYFDRIERMDKSLLLRMCDALNCDISDLLRIVDDDTPGDE